MIFHSQNNEGKIICNSESPGERKEICMTQQKKSGKLQAILAILLVVALAFAVGFGVKNANVS